MPARTRARRMSPEARQQAIVAAAIALFLEKGSASSSLEQIACAAGISKPLIYKYFPNREALLTAILEREFTALSGQGLNSIPDATDIEQVIRSTVERALRYYHEHGPILRLLAAEPSLSDLTRAGNQTSRESTTQYFIRRLSDHYQVPEDVARIAVIMVVNAPIQSMTHLRRHDVDIDLTIEVWSEFILGGWRALEKRYGEQPGV